jgi:protein-S-isoprenylcysteine O-methyltransferase Ste14
MNTFRANSRWGIGPGLGIVTAAYMLLATGLTYCFPNLLTMHPVPRRTFYGAAVVLGFSGAMIYVWSLACLNRALRAGCLATRGPFAVVRHPIYAAWILLILPSVALALRSWPLLAAPAVAYVRFRMLVAREDRTLEESFGDAYRTYRRRVPEFIPGASRRGRKRCDARTTGQP